MRLQTHLALAAASLLTASCSPKDFTDLRDEAPIRVFDRPSDFSPRAFGVILDRIETSIQVGSGDDAREIATGRFLVGGGSDEAYAFYHAWFDGQSDLEGPELVLCQEDSECRRAPTAGFALTALPGWGSRRSCSLVTVPAANRQRVRCEEQTTTDFLQPATENISTGNDLALGDGDEVGWSADGFPALGHPAGVALLGAPGIDADTGGVFFLGDDATIATRLTLRGVDLQAGDRLGEAISIGEVDETALEALNGAPDLESPAIAAVRATGRQEVWLFAVGGDTAGAGPVADAIGCIEGSTALFGGVVDVSDLTGDGLPEVIVSDALPASAMVTRNDTVHLFSLSDLVAAFAADGSCVTAGAAQALTCPGDTAAEAGEERIEDGCPGADFGAAFETVDVDADGNPELLVGAPGTAVNGVEEAGAAFLFVADSSGGELVRATPEELFFATDESEGARFGGAVTGAPTHLDTMAPRRDEPVVAAAGSGDVYVFRCTALELLRADETEFTGGVAGLTPEDVAKQQCTFPDPMPETDTP